MRASVEALLGLANFYEKALFVKADVAAFCRGRAQQLGVLRAMLLFAVNTL